MNEDSLSSGFFGEDIPSDTLGFTDLKEIYVAASGYSQLHVCRRLGRLHILKSLQPEYASQEFYRQLLLKEFNISYPLEHPNIRHTLGMERHETLGTCIVMEYVDGIPLTDFLQPGKLSQPLAHKFIREICSALQYIHGKQLIHKDIKPANILITYNGNNVKIIDFGLADCDDYAMLKIPAGTKKYLAPEQLIPGASIDYRTDIYSFGVIIGEMATLLKDPQLSAIAHKCTQEDPANRYQSTADILTALEKKRTSPTLKYVAAGISLLALVILSVMFLRPRQLSAIQGNYSLPVYGNSTVGNTYQKILLKERKELHRKIARFTADRQKLSQDSVRITNKLTAILNDRFPEKSQRETAIYKQQLRSIRQDVAREIAAVRTQLR